MISKAELDLAESVLIAYEYHMRDRIRQGHCVSIEYRYKPDHAFSKPENQPYYQYHKPEVYDMVASVMRELCWRDRRVWGILMSKYSKVSPFYKRQTQAVLKKNQRRRYTNVEWATELNNSLSIFWLMLKREKGFNKYFMYGN